MAYQNYINYITSITDLSNSDFKKNPNYTEILEHVSYELGIQYLNLIELEFTNINYNNIIDYININDKYGNTNKYTYTYKQNRFLSSPTSLRYIYHALVILQHYKNTNCKNMVEVGCGYGGLCLAINFFSKINNVCIDNYNIIDIPEVVNLIKKYIILNKSYIQTNMIYHNSDTYGSDVADNMLFFISNYCYTEISEIYNKNYSHILLPKVKNGFIAWQSSPTTFPIENANKITGKLISSIIEEKPQTVSSSAKICGYTNYFVYF